MSEPTYERAQSMMAVQAEPKLADHPFNKRWGTSLCYTCGLPRSEHPPAGGTQ